MSAGEASTVRAVLFALGANGGIAISKFVAAFFTGSGAMLAEAIHSTADCGNQMLLLLGLKRSKQPESEEHPLGHHRVTYFYSMLVALLLFFMGGAFSAYEGVERLMHPQPLANPLIAALVLGIGLALEAFSLWGALREINKIRGDASLWRWFRETRESELMVVLGEDVAALLGLGIAFVAVMLATVTGDPRWDAAGTLVIGVLLMVIAYALLREVKAMITGESAAPQVRRAILAHLQARAEIRRIIRLITLQWGDKLVIAVQAEMHPQGGEAQLVVAINRVEESLQRAFPQARWVFFEPDVKRGDGLATGE